jgi:hypothetical protein
MKTKILVPIMILLLVAALAIPVSASEESGLADGDPLVSSLGHFIPGYGIIAHTISLDAHPDKIPADGVSTSTINIQLKDKRSRDVKVKDVIINFRTNKGILSANSAVTDINGRASVTLTSSTKPEKANIKASSDSVLMPGKTEVEFEKVASDIYRISLTAAPDQIPADGKSTSTIFAQLKDKHGNDVSVKDVIINFVTTEGTLKTGSAITDKHGRASVTLKSSTKPGTADIKATSNDVLKPGTVEVDFKKVESHDRWNNEDSSRYGFNFGDRSGRDDKTGNDDMNSRKGESSFQWDRQDYSRFGFNFRGR